MNTAHASLTILAQGGRMNHDLLGAVHSVCRRLGLTAYCTTAQNLRLLGVPEDAMEQVKRELADHGAVFKKPGMFPKPRVCVGRPFCKLALVDPCDLSEKICAGHDPATAVKPKIKIAIAACPASCSGPLTTDIGVVAVANGFRIYAGGKDGTVPRSGRLVGKNLGEDEMVQAVHTLFSFHQQRTTSKQRMSKLLDDPEFPHFTTPL